MLGVDAVSSSLFDLGLLRLFGVMGYALGKRLFPTGPLVLGRVLGDGMEKALRKSLMMSRGDIAILWQRPIPAVLLAIAVLLLVVPLFKKFNAMRVQVIDQEA